MPVKGGTDPRSTAKLIVVGREYGKYTVIKLGSPYSLCRCRCGKEKLVRNSHMVSGRVGGCHACANGRIRPGRRVMASDLPKHIYSRLRALVANAIRRCTDSDHPHWMYYGGRGITVHPKWLSDPSRFLAYLTNLPGHDNPSLVIDRKNNNKGYMPGNLRFVTKSESQRNKGSYRNKGVNRGTVSTS